MEHLMRVHLSPQLDAAVRPLRITAVLGGKLLGWDLPRLDAILEYRAAVRASLDVRSPPPDLKPGGVAIPLEKKMVSGFNWPIPLCSDPIASDCLTDGHNFYAKRFPAERADILHPSCRHVVNTTGGPFKSYMLPIRARQIGKIVWFCVGSATAIADLLAEVFVVGKKKATGGAMVSAWEIEAADSDVSWFASDVLMRTLPATAERPAGLLGFRKHFGGVVAPYWQRQFHCEVITPC
jgi:hypothetical protein